MEPAVSSLTSNFSREGDVPPTLQGGVGSHAPRHTHPLLEEGLRVKKPSSSPQSTSSSRISGQRTPTSGSFMQRRPSETPKSHSQNQIWPHRTETSPEDYGLGTRPDHGFHGLLGNPLLRFKGKACLLVYSIALAEGFQTNSPPWTGRPTPYRSHGHHVSPPPRGRETRLPVPGFISGEVTRQDEGPSSLQGIQKP